MIESFYVMQEIDGEECLLCHRDTEAAAIEAMQQEAARDQRANLSVWSSTGGIRALLSEGELRRVSP